MDTAFAHSGVHRWEATATWHIDLTDAAQAFTRPPLSRAQEETERKERDALIERLATEPAAMPAFRRGAATDPDARAAAYRCDEMAALLDQPNPGWIASYLLREARARVDTQAARLYGDLEADLPTIAAELAADDTSRGATTGR